MKKNKEIELYIEKIKLKLNEENKNKNRLTEEKENIIKKWKMKEIYTKLNSTSTILILLIY
ncbi:hypothetical protein [Xenorhabdus sp. NBAII XenSa04]|uniref:hypothetical protein n=1 Tax=Xenorhabdus sp. NBAII XenSa04 TaxID=1429873 RepID=UPI000645AF36|nr:hypothetical protein [Xenorhabdus sp. NBAII XenSa04]